MTFDDLRASLQADANILSVPTITCEHSTFSVIAEVDDVGSGKRRNFTGTSNQDVYRQVLNAYGPKPGAIDALRNKLRDTVNLPAEGTIVYRDGFWHLWGLGGDGAAAYTLAGLYDVLLKAFGAKTSTNLFTDLEDANIDHVDKIERELPNYGQPSVEADVCTEPGRYCRFGGTSDLEVYRKAMAALGPRRAAVEAISDKILTTTNAKDVREIKWTGSQWFCKTNKCGAFGANTLTELYARVLEAYGPKMEPKPSDERVYGNIDALRQILGRQGIILPEVSHKKGVFTGIAHKIGSMPKTFNSNSIGSLFDLIVKHFATPPESIDRTDTRACGKAETLREFLKAEGIDVGQIAVCCKGWTVKVREHTFEGTSIHSVYRKVLHKLGKPNPLQEPLTENAKHYQAEKSRISEALGLRKNATVSTILKTISEKNDAQMDRFAARTELMRATLAAIIPGVNVGKITNNWESNDWLVDVNGKTWGAKSAAELLATVIQAHGTENERVLAEQIDDNAKVYKRERQAYAAILGCDANEDRIRAAIRSLKFKAIGFDNLQSAVFHLAGIGQPDHGWRDALDLIQSRLKGPTQFEVLTYKQEIENLQRGMKEYEQLTIDTYHRAGGVAKAYGHRDALERMEGALLSFKKLTTDLHKIAGTNEAFSWHEAIEKIKERLAPQSDTLADLPIGAHFVPEGSCAVYKYMGGTESRRHWDGKFQHFSVNQKVKRVSL